MISSPCTSIHDASLAKNIMSDVILIFSMLSIVVIHDCSNFKPISIDMCFTLRIQYCFVSRGNHLSNLVEHYHQFLNKIQTFSCNDRTINKVFIRNTKHNLNIIGIASSLLRIQIFLGD